MREELTCSKCECSFSHECPPRPRSKHDELCSFRGDDAPCNCEQPQIEAINAADKCCNWLQSDDDPIEHDERMTCAKFIQSAINAALAAKQRYIDEIRTTTYSDLEKQLAAERERYRTREIELIEGWSAVERDLHKQLVDEREKTEKLARLIIDMDGGKLTFDHAKVLYEMRVKTRAAEDFGHRICAGLIAARNAGWSQERLAKWISEQYSAALADERKKVANELGIGVRALVRLQRLERELADEREKVKLFTRNPTLEKFAEELVELRSQLAAEREKVKILTNALNEGGGPYATADALAKVTIHKDLTTNKEGR